MHCIIIIIIIRQSLEKLIIHFYFLPHNIFAGREEVRKLNNDLNVSRETQKNATAAEELAGKKILTFLITFINCLVDQEKVGLSNQLEEMTKKCEENEASLNQLDQSHKKLQEEHAQVSLQLENTRQSVNQLEGDVNDKVSELKGVREEVTALKEKSQSQESEIEQLSKALEEEKKKEKVRPTCTYGLVFMSV